MTAPKPNKRGPKPGTGGRPKGPEKVQLSTWVLPSTLATVDAMGERGPVIDALVAKHLTTKPTTPTS